MTLPRLAHLKTNRPARMNVLYIVTVTHIPLLNVPLVALTPILCLPVLPTDTLATATTLSWDTYTILVQHTLSNLALLKPCNTRLILSWINQTLTMDDKFQHILFINLHHHNCLLPNHITKDTLHSAIHSILTVTKHIMWCTSITIQQHLLLTLPWFAYLVHFGDTMVLIHHIDTEWKLILFVLFVLCM